MLKYEKWDQEELLEPSKMGYLLQWDLAQAPCNIPFRIIEWVSDTSSSGAYELSTEIEIIYVGHIKYDGVRHSRFTPEDGGYGHYIRPIGLAKGLTIIANICREYCIEGTYTL